ncbi:hypothetical protein ACD661_06800 [Legionella lytica]|uniref:Substrate of the Dot/Icm secretion system n=1 Tax=Legionella lytica TaxID=96232 RepID=A0ABW8D9K1_9GAMM
MTFDDKNNIVEVCIFESFLAKYFLEHSEVFSELYNKIYEAIENLRKINEKNEDFERKLYMSLSPLIRDYPAITDLTALKESGGVLVWDTFLKYFTEIIMSMEGLLYPELQLENPVTPHNALAQYGLFSSNPVQVQKLILEKIRPDYLFTDAERGCMEVKKALAKPSFNLGILFENKMTVIPESLVNYLKFANYPSKQIYAPKEDSEMADWLREHYLPVISGASGSIGKIVSALSTLCIFSSEEYKLLGLLVASATVALGHHSFFEVLRPLSFMTGFIEEQSTLLEFYEQAIPPEIKALASYKEHINGPEGALLIQDMGFDETDEEQDEEALVPSSF